MQPPGKRRRFGIDGWTALIIRAGHQFSARK
jgi:hypothetical protein